MLLVGTYLFAALLTLAYWHFTAWNFQTGDEPHYMIMANGIARHGTLEQTVPYLDDMREHRFWNGWAKTDTPSNNGHTVLGPHGLFNDHSIGLPVLLALPVLIHGAGGAKTFMVLLSSLVVVVAWKIAGLFFANQTGRFWSVATLTIGLPLIVASSQVYTEVPAGLICLTALYWLLTIERERPVRLELLYALGLAYLPWLHLKLIGATIILATAIALKMLRDHRPIGRVALLVALCAGSGGLLAFYNWYAFGHLLGPYTGNEFEATKTSLMVFLGLLLDQNHGFLMQNPIQFLGIFALASFFAARPFVAITWSLLLADILVPNGTYDAGWYGAWSFVGRFEWTAAIIFFVPTLQGLAMLWNRKRLFAVLCAANSLLQLHFYLNYTFRKALLINKWGISVPFPLPKPNDYSPFYGRLERFMPSFGNTAWAFHFAPNYVFALITIAVFLGGFRASRDAVLPATT